jgi:hypothetical protein
MKKCTKCKETKSPSLFGNHIKHKDGKRYRCKACTAADVKEKREAKKLINPAALAEKERINNIKRMYGLSILEWTAKLETQKGVCAICSGTCVSGRRLSVDHNHTTGKIRDLLCGNCNHGLGKFLDSPELLLKAVDYLRKHK